MESIFSIVRLAFLIIGSVCLLPSSALAGPPDWAPAHGYRSKHEGKHHDKHHHKKESRHRDGGYEHSRYSEDDDSSEDYRHHRRYGRYSPYYHKDDGLYPRPVLDRRVWRNERPVFVKGECTPRFSGRESGAALGGVLASQASTSNAAMVATGTLLGAILGSRADGAAAADEDCMQQFLERAGEKEQVAWNSAASRYKLTPVRNYRKDGRACREFLTTVVQKGKFREVYRAACRNNDGKWRLVN
ncbi:MAG: RT0821/Lpp0805 family surface protein [Pseudomonadota bacterium]|nr:RT0821/Lpp0805 family surface protein [Pseudomonadota bacterium]